MTQLKMLPIKEYVGVNRDDPIRFYSVPVVGGLYRRRVEMCLDELGGGERVLEVGYGSGVTFLNLHEKYRQIYGLDLTAAATDVQAAWVKRGIQTDLCNGDVCRMAYEDNFFDSILAISIFEHLKPAELSAAFKEIRRVLKPGGQLVYGVPVERPLMVFFFRLLGYDIHQHHFSTEKNVAAAASQVLKMVRLAPLKGLPGMGTLYEVGHLVKAL